MRRTVAIALSLSLSVCLSLSLSLSPSFSPSPLLAKMPSKKKKYNARFPPARIKKIMQTDEDVGKVAAAVPVIISRALELFIESLILKASETTQTRQAKTLTTAHIKQTIESEKKFDFLRDLVANITDHQAEDDLEGSNVNETKKPKVSRTRKRKEGIGRRKERKTSSDSTQAEADDDEEEDEDEDSDDDDEAERSSTQPATSQPIFITKPPSIPTNNGMQFPCPTQTLPFMPTPSFSGMFPPVQATVQEDDDYDT